MGLEKATQLPDELLNDLRTTLRIVETQISLNTTTSGGNSEEMKELNARAQELREQIKSPEEQAKSSKNTGMKVLEEITGKTREKLEEEARQNERDRGGDPID